MDTVRGALRVGCTPPGKVSASRGWSASDGDDCGVDCYVDATHRRAVDDAPLNVPDCVGGVGSGPPGVRGGGAPGARESLCGGTFVHPGSALSDHSATRNVRDAPGWHPFLYGYYYGYHRYHGYGH